MTEGLFAEPGKPAPEAPVPPLRLRRVRLQGVGPDGARFDPLDLDFATEDGAASRVLLSLTNTGGKSTLITLVCSVVVPAARSQVGGKLLGDYVLTGDTSHVVCDWEDATSGARIVTGTVMEWKDGRRQPAHAMRSTTNMHRAWYLFHTGPGLPGVDDLPFIRDGRRVPYRDFHSAVGDLIAGNTATRGVITDKQQDWTTALEERTSLDPTLFGYQMRMNDSEAGAEKLLSSFNSPDQVVRFFVAALNDQRELETFTGKLVEYAKLAAQRANLEALSAWGAQAVRCLEQIAANATAAATAAGLAEKARALGGELATAIDNRITQDQRSMPGLDGAVRAAQDQAAAAGRAYGQISDIRLQLQLERARAEVTAAEREHSRAESAEASARRDEEAWRAVDPVIDLMTAREEAATAERAYAKADAGLGPLRGQVTNAAARLAGRLDALIQEGEIAAVAADEAASTAAERAHAEQQNITDAAVRISQLTAELTQIEKTLDAAEVARAAAVEQGWLKVEEKAGAALRRWQAAHTEAVQDGATAQEAAEQAEARYDQADQLLRSLEPQLAERNTAATHARADLGRFDDALAAVGGDATVQELLGGRPTDVGAVLRATNAADAAADDADALAAGHEATAEQARREIAHLDETGTAPAGADALAVLAVLVEARVWAVTGLSWIERNIIAPDERGKFIVDHPGLSSGVVITDPARFDDAVLVLDAHPPHTRTPVAVTIAPTTTQGPSAMVAEERHHIVVPHRATWDREWAERRRDSLAETESAASRAAADAKAAAGRYRAASALSATFIRQWAEPGRVELARRADAATAEHDATQQLVRQQQAGRDAAHAQARARRADRERHLAAAGAAEGFARAARRLCDLMTAADQAAARRITVRAQERQARSDEESARSAAAQAAAESEAAIRRAAGHRATAEALSRERGEMGVDRSAPDPGGSVDALRSSWAALHERLAEAESGLVEATRLETTRKRVSKALERLRLFSEETRAAAEALAGTVEASSQITRTEAVGRATAAHDEARRTLVVTENNLTEARRALRDAQPAGDRQNHFDLTGSEWAPSATGDIPALLERLEIRNAELRAARDIAEEAAAEAIELRDEVSRDITSFTDVSGLWVPDRVATVEIFTGSRDLARTEMRERVGAQQTTDTAARAAADALRQAVAEARGVANRPQWSRLTAPAVVRLRELPDQDLVAESELLTTRVRAMSASAAADLRDLDEHRSILRNSLQSLCREQRRLLREVSRSSRLPDGLGDLSQQPAIKIRFDDAPDSEAAARLAHRIDTWADELTRDPKRARSAEVRARWLAESVRDTVVDRARAGAWAIEILKPRIDGHVIYCPPDRIPAEFSGGQVLTLAVLVYCALSRVRAAHRQGGARPPGTLLLDNPFGAASAEALIEMQHRLAAHSGVQLVCATGLHDPAVDAAFTGPRSVIVKLRNDGDLRRNLSHLRLRAAVVDGIDVAGKVLNGRVPEATQNWVDATRYEVRR